MVFIKKFIYFGTSMFVGVTDLKEMVFASGMSDGILCNVIHWKVNMFYFFSKGEYIVVGCIKVRDGILGIKIREKTDCIMKVGGRFKVHKKFI